VTRLTVSAMVDTRALGSEDGLTDVERERYTALIRDAIGFDEARRWRRKFFPRSRRLGRKNRQRKIMTARRAG